MSSYFGKKAKDKVTGFTGIVTGRSEWIYGCDQYCLVPEVDKEGKMQEGQWFDDGRIEILEDFISPEEVRVEKNGADHNNMPCAR